MGNTKLKKTLLLAIPFLAIVAGILITVERRNAYDIAHPSLGPITEAVYGLGKVKSNHRFELILGVISNVERLYTDEGATVKKGAPLIKLEGNALFHAPFDGTVTFVAVREGETALPHVPLLRVENLRDRFIELSLEQQAALRIQPGQKARVSLESLRGSVLEGEVTALFPRQNEFLAHISVAGLKPQILPGMTADVTVEVGTIPSATLVPLRALQNGMLTVNKNGSWKKIKVEVGHIDGAFAEILSGDLKPDDEIRMKKGN